MTIAIVTFLDLAIMMNCNPFQWLLKLFVFLFAPCIIRCSPLVYYFLIHINDFIANKKVVD